MLEQPEKKLRVNIPKTTDDVKVQLHVLLIQSPYVFILHAVLEFLQELMIGAVKFHRSNRYKLIRDSPAIRALLILKSLVLAANPEIRTAAMINSLKNTAAIETKSLFHRLKTFDFI